jgi:hypothetical protein
MSDEGINLAFNSHGIDDATFGMPTFGDGWKGLIITGSSQRALNGGNGGRLLLHVKCVHDFENAGDVGKQHLISLNMWHNDATVAERAKQELSSIMRAINGGQDMAINSTRELYNRPFRAKASTQTPAPTPQYLNPSPQTNWRGYATQDGREIGGSSGGQSANNGGGGGAGGPPNFGQNGNNGNPQGGNAGWNQPNGQNQQQQPQNGNGNNGQPDQQPSNGWGGPQSGAPNNGQGNGAPNPNNAQNGGGWGGPNGQNAQTPSPSDNGQNWGGNNGQQQQQPNNGGGGWGPQGGNGGGNQGGNPAPWG